MITLTDAERGRLALWLTDLADRDEAYATAARLTGDKDGVTAHSIRAMAAGLLARDILHAYEEEE